MLSESGKGLLGQHAMVVRRGRRLAGHWDVFALVPFCQVAGRRVDDGQFWYLRLASLDSCDDAFSFLAGLVFAERTLTDRYFVH